MQKRIMVDNNGIPEHTMTDNNEAYDVLPGIKYEVEYLRKVNADAEEKACLRDSRIDPWELRDKFYTDSLGRFVHEIMIRLCDDNTVDFWPFLRTEKNTVHADIPSTLRYSLRNAVNREANNKIDTLEKEVENLKKELNSYRAFVDEYHASGMFKDWRKKQNEKRNHN